MYFKDKNPFIKFEQGYNQKEFIYNLFIECQPYTFMENPAIRYSNGKIKSYWFKTFSHSNFKNIWDITYENNKKVIKKDIIIKNINEIGLVYWIIGDGSLHKGKRVIILHTQGFNLSENEIISNELNKKFNFNTSVKQYKKNYYVVKFSAKDGNKLHNIIKKYTIKSMNYKIPKYVKLLNI